MTLSRRQLLVLLPAAATAWKFVLAGTPEAAPNYKLPNTGGACYWTSPSASAAGTASARARWKTMFLKDISGPGWSAITSTTISSKTPEWIRLTVARKAFHPADSPTERTSSYPSSATTARIPRARRFARSALHSTPRTESYWWIRNIALVAVIASRLVPMAAATSIPPNTLPINVRSAITASPRA